MTNKTKTNVIVKATIKQNGIRSRSNKNSIRSFDCLPVINNKLTF